MSGRPYVYLPGEVVERGPLARKDKYPTGTKATIMREESDGLYLVRLEDETLTFWYQSQFQRVKD